MILETKRLYLREMKETDFTDLCAILCDEHVMYAYEHAFSTEEVQMWLHHQILRYKEDGVGLWAIIRKSDHVMVGQCGITKQRIPHRDVWEIGYLLKKEFWGMGYASEASQGCKKYAFEVMKLTYIYSIIRDTNKASQRVAINNGMRVVASFVKHYHHINMPHDIYCVENKALLKHVYIDAEFDAVKFDGRYHQMVISIGAVCSDGNGKQTDTFYDTIRPMHYQKTSKVVLKMTGLSEEVIRASRSLKSVLADFTAWLHKLDSNDEHFLYYSFGPDDKRTLTQHCNIEQVDGTLFSSIKDLQKPISAAVLYAGHMVSPTLSLDNLKMVYDIQGVVEHNALTDALDLMHIHQAYLDQKPCDQEQIQAIIKRKEEKLAEAKRKQQKRLQTILKKRFYFVKDCIEIRFLPDVLEQFRSWEAHDAYFTLHFKKDKMLYEEDVYFYAQLVMQMEINVQVEVPYVALYVTYEQQSFEKRYLLTYRNASVIENIFKRLKA